MNLFLFSYIFPLFIRAGGSGFMRGKINLHIFLYIIEHQDLPIPDEIFLIDPETNTQIFKDEFIQSFKSYILVAKEENITAYPSGLRLCPILETNNYYGFNLYFNVKLTNKKNYQIKILNKEGNAIFFGILNLDIGRNSDAVSIELVSASKDVEVVQLTDNKGMQNIKVYAIFSTSLKNIGKKSPCLLEKVIKKKKIPRPNTIQKEQRKSNKKRTKVIIFILSVVLILGILSICIKN